MCVGKTIRGGSCGAPPRFEHDDCLVAQPTRIEERERYASSLTGAGRSLSTAALDDSRVARSAGTTGSIGSVVPAFERVGRLRLQDDQELRRSPELLRLIDANAARHLAVARCEGRCERGVLSREDRVVASREVDHPVAETIDLGELRGVEIASGRYRPSADNDESLMPSSTSRPSRTSSSLVPIT